AGDAGHAVVPGPLDARELVVAAAGEDVCELLLVPREHVNAERVAVDERAVAAARVVDRYEHRRRLGAERRHGGRHQPARVAVLAPRRYDRDARDEAGHRLPEELGYRAGVHRAILLRVCLFARPFGRRMQAAGLFGPLWEPKTSSE